MDLLIANKLSITNALLHQIDQRIRDIFQDALNEGHSFRQVYGPEIDKIDAAQTIEARQKSQAATLQRQHYDKGLLDEAKVLVGTLPRTRPSAPWTRSTTPVRVFCGRGSRPTVFWRHGCGGSFI